MNQRPTLEELMDLIVEHAESQEHFHQLDNPTYVKRGLNPHCGDEIELQLIVEERIVTEASYRGTGCLMSRGAASLLCERIIGQSIDEIKNHETSVLVGFDSSGFSIHRQFCARLAASILKEAVSQS
ncbi:NifU-like protein [Thalassoglobus neptunius]|uniref:NifU-like protein n=1 Tax=Thalassoglobus neptunius TaxID=1938619 RepID=A0A5C5VMZ0_9PLAN|nr:iron-sulfur cluster assembly scaffold protein [Thalassoglobus neptunius]TWT39908.1 NifU-like protein [Thalassoglobus neptunius]